MARHGYDAIGSPSAVLVTLMKRDQNGRPLIRRVGHFDEGVMVRKFMRLLDSVSWVHAVCPVARTQSAASKHMSALVQLCALVWHRCMGDS